MTSTKFELDEEKIKANPNYSLENLYKEIEEAARITHFKKINKGYYICDDINSPAYMGAFVFNCMINNECFTKHLKSWLWIDNDKNEEDIITFLKSKNKGVWE